MVRKIPSFLASLEIYIASLSVLVSMVKPDGLPWTVGILIFFWIIRACVTGRLSRRTPLDWPIIGLLVLLPINLLVTSQPAVTRLQILRLLSGIGLYYAIVNWKSMPQRFHWQTLAISFTGLTLALFAPFSVTWPLDKSIFFPAWVYTPFKMMVTDPVHPNVISGALVLLLPVPLSAILFAPRPRPALLRILDWTASLSMLVILFLTLSRGAWLALAAALVTLAFLHLRLGLPGRQRIIVALAAIGIVTLAGVLSYRAIIQPSTAPGSPAPGGLAERLEIWSRAIYMIEDFPFSGVGMGLFGTVADALYPSGFFAPGVLEHAHNLFLQVAVDLGLPGLVIYLMLVISALWCAWMTWKKGRTTQNSELIYLGAGLLSSQVAMVAHGMIDSVVWGMIRSAPLVWAVWGVTIATYLFNNSDSLENSHMEGNSQ